MAKLEQLSELLVSEIGQFEKTVEKLQRIQEEKIGIDSRAFENLFKEHQINIKEMLEDHCREMKNLGENLEKSKAYPVWALTLFTASIMVNGILIYILIFDY